MTEQRDDEGLADKARDAAEKIKDTLESSGSDAPGAPINDASDPFTDDQRPDETGFPHGSVAGTD